MKTVLILHGIQGHAGIHWQQWLHDELVKRNIPVLMPELPHSIKPDRQETLKFVLDFIKKVNPSDLIITGHSLGVATALDVIGTINEKIPLLISVSGFSQDYGAALNSYFMKEKTPDMQKVRNLVGKAVVAYGDNDPYVPQNTLKQLAEELHTEPIVLHNGGHLNTEAGYTTFPLLLNKIVRDCYDIYKAAGVIIRDRKLLLLKSSHQDMLVLPGGKIEDGETAEEALIREMHEELSITFSAGDYQLLGIDCGEAVGRNNENKTICMETFLINKFEEELKPQQEIEELIWINTQNKDMVDKKMLTVTRIIPRLLKLQLID